ncbi:unnamed protein product [Amoebophrya sp. A25]|nr:unnamed protein product [Amoebophrya sp. A25]|eukprot:GSA25T00021081001.1
MGNNFSGTTTAAPAQLTAIITAASELPEISLASVEKLALLWQRDGAPLVCSVDRLMEMVDDVNDRDDPSPSSSSTTSAKNFRKMLVEYVRPRMGLALGGNQGSCEDGGTGLENNANIVYAAAPEVFGALCLVARDASTSTSPSRHLQDRLLRRKARFLATFLRFSSRRRQRVEIELIFESAVSGVTRLLGDDCPLSSTCNHAAQMALVDNLWTMFNLRSEAVAPHQVAEWAIKNVVVNNLLTALTFFSTTTNKEDH